VLFILLFQVFRSDDIPNLYLLPLFYSFTLPLVKKYYGRNICIAATIIEITKFVRYLVLPIIYVLSDNPFVNDSTLDNNSTAVRLMCYELIAVSIVMFLFSYRKTYKVDNIFSLNFSPSKSIYLLLVLWLFLIFLFGSYREQLLNFSVATNVTIGTSSPSNNLFNIVFEIGKIYVFVILLSLINKNNKNRNFFFIIIVSILYISSNWNDGGESVSRWGLIVSTLVSIYAIVYYYPEKIKIIISTGVIFIFIVVVASSLLKLFVWGFESMEMSDATNILMGPEMLDLYFQGVYGVSNGILAVDQYSSFVGFKNFLTEIFYHFPFAVRLFGLEHSTWAEYYFKLSVGDISKICPNITQSAFYFGFVGSPFFSCLSASIALYLTKLMERSRDFCVRLLYIYGIFWSSLLFCVNYTVVEAHIWFCLIGVWICQFDKHNRGIC